MIKIEEVLSIYKEAEIDRFLKKYTNLDLNEKNLSYSDIERNYKFLGNTSSNGSIIGQLTCGEKGLVERITNAVDAVIEKKKEEWKISTANNSGVIIKKAFPQYYAFTNQIKEHSGDRLNAKDADEQVILAVNDGSKSNKPTFDVMDKGTGLLGSDFENTILSINGGNKLSREKSYLIGAFGQGGSTSLPFAHATIIISKKDEHISFTIIKKVELRDYKNLVYVYLTINEKIPELDYSNFSHKDEYITDFIKNNKSGTLVRMIELDISKGFRDNEVTKPGMLGDYLNTELFNIGLPVKIIENRSNYKNNSSSQDRSVYGSLLKLKTTKYVKKDYCGTIDIVHNGHPYNIDYYVLLPRDESKWGSESECKSVFAQFNAYYDPILYTVNGQTIATEKYTKINNAGLNFLRYRLLVIINLDILDTEKYKFFTSDRARIVDSDLTHGFLNSVIKELANTEKLKEINTIIGEKSIKSSINQDLLDEVSRQVKNEYTKFLKPGTLLSGNKYYHSESSNEEVYEDHIEVMDITSSKREFYKDESVVFVLTTKAQKHINKEKLIYCFINGKMFDQLLRNYMNGKIQYSINAGVLKPNEYKIQFMYFDPDFKMESDAIQFSVIDEHAPEKKSSLTKNLDLKIDVLDEASLICEVARDQVNKAIHVMLCLDTDQLKSEIYGLSASSDEIMKIKNRIIKPIALFALFYGESYDNIEDDDEKNKIIISFIKAFIGTIDTKTVEVVQE